MNIRQSINSLEIKRKSVISLSQGELEKKYIDNQDEDEIVKPFKNSDKRGLSQGEKETL